MCTELKESKMYKNQYIPRGIFQRPETKKLNMATSFSKKLITAMVLVLMLFGVQKASATHIVGGEITYRSLGMMGMNLEKFEVTLTVYRDCNTINPNAVFDDPGRIAVFHTRPDGTIFYEYSTLPFRMGDDTLSTNINPACDPVAANVCVHRTLYRDTITLDRVEGVYTLAYQRCCRNVTVSNIVDPLETGMTLAVEITAEARAAANSGPVFKTWPDVFICVGEPLDYDHGANDVESDSVVYRLCTPYHGATRAVPIPVIPGPPPYEEVVWAPNFSTANMLGGANPLTIDPVTGIFSGIPEIPGQFLVAVCMDEYRDGVFFSTTRRDFEYNVIACGEMPTADFNAPELQCGDLTVTFENTSSGHESSEWFFDWPATTPTSNSNAATVTHTYDEEGTYVVALIVDNGTGCTDTIFKTITLRNSDIDIDFTFEQFVCGDSITTLFADITTSTISPLVSNVWTIIIGNDTTIITDVLNPTLNIPDGASVKVTLTVTTENGCTESITKEFISESEIGLIPDFDTEIIKCNDIYTINVTDLSVDAPGTIESWFYELTALPNGQTSPDQNPTFEVEGFQTVTLTLTVTSTSGCIGTITKTFPLTPDIDLEPEFSYNVLECDENLVIEFTDNSFNGPGPDPVITGRVWKVVVVGTTDTLTFLTPNFIVTYDTSVTILVSLTNTYDNGCVTTSSEEYEFDLLGDHNLPSEYEVCPGKRVQLNVNPNKPGLQYNWSPTNSLFPVPAGSLESPWAGPEVTTTYSVTITDPDLNCSIIREVTVTVKDEERADFTFVTECGSPEVTFTKTAGGPVVRWEFGDNSPASFDDPTTTHIYADTSRTYMATLYTGGDCPDTISKEIKIVFIDTDFIVDSIPACDGDTVFLNPNFNPAYSYLWSPADKIIGNVTDPNPRAFVTETTTFKVTIYDLTMDTCGVMKEVVVFVPDPITLNTDSFLEFCKDTTIQLIAFSPTAASYTWVNQNGDTLGMGDTIDVFLETDDVITVIVIDIFGCRIEKSVAVSFFQVVFNSENPLCIGDTTTIFITVPGVPPVSYVWSPANQIISGGNTNSIVVSPTETTEYTVVVTYPDGCVLTGTYTQVVSDFMANMSISMDPDTIIAGSTATLTVTPCPTIYTFSWEPSNLVVDPNSCETETVELEETTAFTVTVTNEDGCELVLSTSVTVTDPRCEEPFIFLPNLFTPNGDGINDVLLVKAFEPFITSVELLIYNRYGTEIFKSTSLNDGWDGTFQGEALQTDAFAFYLKVICIDGQTFTKKGNVTLIR
jgi:gliding motility-associated-like protein